MIGKTNCKIGSVSKGSLEDHGSYYTFANNTIPETLFEYAAQFKKKDSGTYTLRICYNSDIQDILCELLENSNTTLSGTVNLGNQSTDGGVVIVRFPNDVTVAANATVTTPYRTRGLCLYIDGNLTVDGTITMDSRGASAEGQNVYLTKDSSGTMLYVPAVGASGGAQYNTSTWACSSNGGANNGSNGTNGATGGGSSGYASSNWSGSYNGGAGGAGTSYSGGAGGGGAYGYSGSGITGGAGSSTGGAGGAGN